MERYEEILDRIRKLEKQLAAKERLENNESSR
jgi:hypothetical protein